MSGLNYQAGGGFGVRVEPQPEAVLETPVAETAVEPQPQPEAEEPDQGDCDACQKK